MAQLIGEEPRLAVVPSVLLLPYFSMVLPTRTVLRPLPGPRNNFVGKSGIIGCFICHRGGEVTEGSEGFALRLGGNIKKASGVAKR